MYLGNDFGVYRTASNGGSWVRLNNGMPFLPVLDFDCYNHAGTRLLRAATFGRGIFELDLNHPESVNEALSGLEVIRAWPNPASQRIWVDLPGGTPGSYTLSVVSVSGKEVASHAVSTTGTTLRTSIDVSQLEPGCYQLLVKSHRELKAYKLVIMR
jgi:hypothetical protein